MWGASNTETEDCWWYAYLHRTNENPNLDLPDTGRYFVQPSGLSPEAENLENLPGGRGYYVNQAKGKSEGWINQFIHAEWGFSASGKPVVASFRAALHVSPHRLIYNPHLPLIAGLDPGLRGSAVIFGQYDLHSRLNTLGELTQSNYGARRLINERIKPYVKDRFPGCLENGNIMFAPDPAASNRQPIDERTIVDEFKNEFGREHVKVETNNRLAIRLNAIDYFTTRLIDTGPALLIDGEACPTLVRALKGGWRWAINQKTDETKTKEPEDNQFTHPGDAFGYLARYCEKFAGRENFDSQGRKVARFTPPRNWGGHYHVR